MNKNPIAFSIPEGYKAIPGFPKHCVSANGDVYSLISGRSLKQCDASGHKIAGVRGTYSTKTSEYVHRLVALAWLPHEPNLEYLEVLHLDSNKTNNHYTNLKWVTGRESSIHNLQYNNNPHYERSRLSASDLQFIIENYAPAGRPRYVTRELIAQAKSEYAELRKTIRWKAKIYEILAAKYDLSTTYVAEMVRGDLDRAMDIRDQKPINKMKAQDIATHLNKTVNAITLASRALKLTGRK